MGSRVLVLLAAALALLAAARVAESEVTCPQVYNQLTPCVSCFLIGGDPTTTCCDGIRYILAVAKNAADRRVVCNCLKTAAQSSPGTNFATAAAIPVKCKIRIPYQLSPSVDCNRIG